MKCVGVFSLCCQMHVAHRAKSISRTISALIGTHLPVGEEKQLYKSILLKKTSVMTRIRTHTLLTTPPPELQSKY